MGNPPFHRSLPKPKGLRKSSRHPIARKPTFRRQLMHEALEQRLLLATGPELFAARPNDGELFLRDGDNELPVAPRELDLLFKGGANLADIDKDTTSLRIIRAGANDRFDVASMRSDLGTGGEVVVDFSAVNLGTSQDGIRLILTESDHGDDSGPTISVLGTDIYVDLNRNPGNETTAGRLINALNDDSDASALIEAEINVGLSNAVTPADVNITDYILQPATVTTDFGTGTYEVRFTARDSGNSGTNLSILVNKQPRGDGAGPRVVAFGNVVRVTLNTTPGSETTAEQLVDAVNQHFWASGLVIAEVVEADLTALDPQNYAPINLGGGVTDNAGASMVSDFWTADGVQIQFKANVANYPGASGDGIKINVGLSDLGLDAPPTIGTDTSVNPPEVNITLNTRAGSQTTAEQLVQAIANDVAGGPFDAAAGDLISAQVITPANSEFTGLVTDHILDNAPLSLDLIGLDGGGSTQATARSDFGTSLDVLFTADPINYAGAAGNFISIQVQRQNLGAGADPTVVVAGTTITVTLNTTPGSETTAQQLMNRINSDAKDLGGNQMLMAQIISAADTDITGVGPMALNLILTKEDAFGTDGLVGVEFTAVNYAVPGGVITIDVTEADRAAGGVPGISVNGSTINVELDTDAASATPDPTTAQQLLTEWANVAAASALATPAVVLGNPATSIVGGGSRTIILDVRDQYETLDASNAYVRVTLTDADQAIVMSDFGAANPLQIRLAAVATGIAGDGITVQVISRDLNAAGVPNVTLVGKNIYVELDTDAASATPSPTTAQQLINSLRSAAGSLIDVTLLYGDPGEVLGGLPNTFSPLVLRGGDDVAVKPGYAGLPGDDPGTPNSDPAEVARINRNEIIVRFAETLPDDLYRIELFAQADVVPGGTALVDTSNNPLVPWNPNADRDFIDFELELGPQAVSVVPQPVTRNVQHVQTTLSGNNITLTFIDQQMTVADNLTPAQLQAAMEVGLANIMPGEVQVSGTAGDWTIAFHGRYLSQSAPLLQADDPAVVVEWSESASSVRSLHQARNQVLVYFNDDPLNPIAAEDPKFYHLIDTAASLTEADDVILLPQSVSYDAEANLAILQFASDLPDATFRLRIGGSVETNNLTLDAINVGTLFNTTAGAPAFEHAGFTGNDLSGSGNVDDVDMFAFSVAAAATITAVASPAPGHDTYLRLFDSAGNPLASNNSGGVGTDDTLSFAVGAGDYFLGASSNGNTTYNRSSIMRSQEKMA